jgi:hypothetical protein
MLNNDAGSHDSESTKGTPTRKPSGRIYRIGTALIVIVVVVRIRGCGHFLGDGLGR